MVEMGEIGETGATGGWTEKDGWSTCAGLVIRGDMGNVGVVGAGVMERCPNEGGGGATGVGIGILIGSGGAIGFVRK
jgi:hypothetical protein